MRKMPLFALALAMLLAGFTSASAAEKPATPDATPTPDAEASAEMAKTYQPFTVMGMKVWIDPETGQMRAPTAEEAAQLAASFQRRLGPRSRTSRSAPPAVASTQKTHANGAVSMQLDAGMLDFSVARVTSEGTIHFDCVEGLDEAATLSKIKVAAPEEE